uniref:hypothetical protein n=1 Tax=uncultured Altererythrobacter sp. TaxID=500840 RepID=UPI00261B1FFD|nr:hypothetical protein [uncultured Altererythrobacter sp.]
MNFRTKIVTGVTLTALVATPLMAEKANQLVDINGMRGSSAESALQERGFAHVSTHKNTSGYVYSYWWDERDDDCVQVEVYNGRVETINDAADQDCGHHKGNAAAAAGAVAGAAILGALLSHKSHHREDRDYDETKTREFERGYQDGLHHAQYHNYNRDDAYAHGYEKGADERQANLGHHHRRGGYSSVARYKDVEGMRGPRARGLLNDRGFSRVSRFGDDNTRYSIMWRSDSRQCIQLTIADGRVLDARDIGNHPDCRG